MSELHELLGLYKARLATAVGDDVAAYRDMIRKTEAAIAKEQPAAKNKGGRPKKVEPEDLQPEEPDGGAAD